MGSETPSKSFSMPAQATITPLSVQSRGGGATSLIPRSEHTPSSAARTAWFAATPPTTAKLDTTKPPPPPAAPGPAALPASPSKPSAPSASAASAASWHQSRARCRRSVRWAMATRWKDAARSARTREGSRPARSSTLPALAGRGKYRGLSSPSCCLPCCSPCCCSPTWGSAGSAGCSAARGGRWASMAFWTARRKAFLRPA
mmetsp:Transcript_41319/g.93076  ORF Transcript_41319/g.93076 Transcript_41319/m.93076 type:complete len:202 (-) Transcript_41319:1243-1848(-)